MKAERLPLATVLRDYRPTDMLDGLLPPSSPISELWADCFASIRSNHFALDPAYWRRFVCSVVKRQWTPIQLSQSRREVVNGHHRVYALALMDKPSVHVVWVD